MRNSLYDQISSGAISIRLSEQKFKKHVDGTLEFQQYTAQQDCMGRSRPSKLYVSFDEAQEIIHAYAGTGIVSPGAVPAEFVTLDYAVGAFEEQGMYYDTRCLKIIYGKRNAHLFPVKELI